MSGAPRRRVRRPAAETPRSSQRLYDAIETSGAACIKRLSEEQRVCLDALAKEYGVSPQHVAYSFEKAWGDSPGGSWADMVEHCSEVIRMRNDAAPDKSRSKAGPTLVSREGVPGVTNRMIMHGKYRTRYTNASSMVINARGKVVNKKKIDAAKKMQMGNPESNSSISTRKDR